MNAKQAWAKAKQDEGATVLNDVLQESDDPVAELKKAGERVAVLVPFEYLWPETLAPFKNPKHRRQYDADLLSEHLSEAGYVLQVLRVLQVDNFIFLTADAIRKPLNSEERRKLKRASLQPVKPVQEVTV